MRRLTVGSARAAGRHLLALGWLAALLATAACGDSTPSASALLKGAQEKFNQTTAMHFVVMVDHPGKPQPGDYVITSATGDVERPDSLSAEVGVDAGLFSTSVKIIIIGSQQYWTDPTNGGQWTPTTEFSNLPIVKLFDPTTGIGTLLTQLQQPSAPADGSANGVACWKISGALTPGALTPLFPDITATKPVPTTFCVDKSNGHLVSASLTGPIFGGDLDNTVHTFYFSKFDEQITIQPPV